jgi:hypothetical protein
LSEASGMPTAELVTWLPAAELARQKAAELARQKLLFCFKIANM